MRQKLGCGGIAPTLLVFGLPAAIIAAPWYVKNLVWFGDPVWPLLAHHPNDFQAYITHQARFGDGLLSLLLVPLRLYTYGSVDHQGVYPPFQLLALAGLVLLPRSRVTLGLLSLALVQYLVWLQSAHIVRYLVQALPAMCLLAACILDRVAMTPRYPGIARVVAGTAMVLGLLIPTASAMGTIVADRPYLQLVGLESREAFIERQVPGARAVAYLNEHVTDVRGVLMIGDDRGFYLRTSKWADLNLEAFQTLVNAPDADTARNYLTHLGVSHVMTNTRDLAFFVPFDVEQRLPAWWQRFEATRAGYLVPELSYGDVTLYRVVETDPSAQEIVGAQQVVPPSADGTTEGRQ